MIHLRSSAFNVAFFVWTALIAVAGLPTLALPRPASVAVQRLWAGGLAWLMRALAGIRVEVRGRAHIPTGAALIAAKHQSTWDTFAFHRLLDNPAMVMKRELFWIPVFGWYPLRSGMIGIDRARGMNAIRRLIRAAKACAARGQPIVIFPEGTRRAVGAPPDYQPGVAALYRELGLPAVPVAVNSGLYWPRRRFVKRPGTIVIEFLPAIPPGLDRARFMHELEAAIEPATARLIRAAGAIGERDGG